MIRDPSDGSVREKPPIDTGTSGLPMTSAKADYLARLAKSHEWLTNYLKAKEATHEAD
jgi:hypothetical protein